MLHGVTRAILLSSLIIGGFGGRAAAQSIADRGDASVVREQVGKEPAAPRELASARPVDRTPLGLAADVGGITVGAVRVEGAMALPVSAFAPAIQPYLGRELAKGELRTLAADVAAVARRLGYGLASATVPRQRLANGVLRVRLDEGLIDAVEVSGDGAGAVQPLLNRLIAGRPIKTAELERQLLLAGDAAGVTTQGARIEERLGRRTLFLQALRRPIEGRVTSDNWGSSVVGPVVATVGLDVNGVTGFRDRLSLSTSVTTQAREYQFVSAAYTLPLGSLGTEVTVSGYYGHLRPGAALRDSDLEGDSAELRLGVSHPLLRSRSTSLWANFDAILRNSDVDRAGAADRRDRIRAASAGFSGLAAVGGGRLRARLALVQGFGLLGATGEGTGLASRSDASAIFTKVEAYASFQRSLGGRFSLAAAMTGQVATRPLLSSMEMGLGGRSFLRAFDYREVSGDSGAAAYLESRFDLGKLLGGMVRKTQIYAYADAGRVHNLRGGQGGGTLASAGGGLRLTLFSGTDASIEIGVPLTDSPYNATPKPRFSFSFSRAF
jgi:hemolysin activation/secretion protein